MAYKGKFQPRNPQKYRGDPTNIIYRSSWELKFMRYLDSKDNVLDWASEEVVIPYRSPIDGKIHRYFPDFIVRFKNKDEQIETFLIEVKPASQTREPQVRTRKTRKYLQEVKIGRAHV